MMLRAALRVIACQLDLISTPLVLNKTIAIVNKRTARVWFFNGDPRPLLRPLAALPRIPQNRAFAPLYLALLPDKAVVIPKAM